VGPGTGLDAEARGKILCLCRGSNPGLPVRSQTLYSYRTPTNTHMLFSCLNIMSGQCAATSGNGPLKFKVELILSYLHS
jgi:hypothetical protein